MYNFNIIVLVAGHTPYGQGGDGGAVFEGYREDLQNIIITEKISSNLQNKGYEVYIAPSHLDYKQATDWVNVRFGSKGVLVIEIHRDGFAGDFRSTIDEISKRMIVLYPSQNPFDVGLANAFVDSLKRQGASPKSRSDYRQDLYLINSVKPNALLIECGFMRGSNTPGHINWLADIVSNAILEVTGKPQTQLINSQQNIDNMLKNKMRDMILADEIVEGVTRDALVNALASESSHDGSYIVDELKYKIKDIKDREKQIEILNSQILNQKVMIEEKEAITLELSEKLNRLEVLVTQLQEQAKINRKWTFNEFAIGLGKIGLTESVLTGIGTILAQVTMTYFNQPDTSKTIAGYVGAILMVLIPYLKGQIQIEKQKNNNQTIKTI